MYNRAVAFVTPNVNTSTDPVLACIAAGPGEGDLVGEPTRRDLRLGEPLVRLSDLSPVARKGYDALLTFAKDPYALFQFTKRRWDSWWCRMLGAGKSVAPYRDGVASNSGFPGQVGHVMSTNGPAETQNRGAMHIHAVITVILDLPRCRMKALVVEAVEDQFRAALRFVQNTVFASGAAVARAIHAPGAYEQYEIPMNERESAIAAKATEVRTLLDRQMKGDESEDLAAAVQRLANEALARKAGAAAALVITAEWAAAPPEPAPDGAAGAAAAGAAEDLRPGLYDSCARLLTVSEGAALESPDKASIRGSVVLHVMEVVRVGDRQRGRIDGPTTGWVTLEKGGVRWVTPPAVPDIVVECIVCGATTHCDCAELENEKVTRFVPKRRRVAGSPPPAARAPSPPAPEEACEPEGVSVDGAENYQALVPGSRRAPPPPPRGNHTARPFARPVRGRSSMGRRASAQPAGPPRRCLDGPCPLRPGWARPGGPTRDAALGFGRKGAVRRLRRR